MNKETMIVSGGNLHRRGASSKTFDMTLTEENAKEDDDKKQRGTRRVCAVFTFFTILCLGVIESESSIRSSLRSSTTVVEPRGLTHNKKEDSKDLRSLLPARLIPGELSPFTEYLNESQANKHAQYVGLPSQLTTELETFVKDSGLLEAFRSVSYEDSPSWETAGNQYGRFAVAGDEDEKDSGIHWFDAVNEEALDETFDALERGGFNVLLEAIGTEYKLKGLQVYDIGFFVVTHSSDDGNDNGDESESNDDMFRLIIPLFQNEETEHGNCVLPAGLSQNIGVLMPSDTYLSTEECDLRPQKGFGVAASIHLADVNENDVDSKNIPREGVKAADWIQDEGEALIWTAR